jgi:ATP-dependent Clp protease protease subunit
MDRDRFMTAEEALEWGLIDRILRIREEDRKLGIAD